jgi:hypothetical protein
MSWTKLTTYLEPILAKGLASVYSVNLSTATSKWVEPPSAFLKGPKRSRPHTAKGHMMGMVWRSWASALTCFTKYWHPLQNLTI